MSFLGSADPEPEATHSRVFLSAGSIPSKTRQTTIFFHASPFVPPSVPPRSAFLRNSDHLPLTMSRMLSIKPCKVRASRILCSL